MGPVTLMYLGGSAGALILGFVLGIAWGKKHPSSAAVIAAQAAKDLAEGEAVVGKAVAHGAADLKSKL
jgi:hypothetical protein